MSFARRTRRWVGAAACLGLVACMDGREGVRPLLVGDPAPRYGARSLAGDSIDLASLRGRPVLVNVWATWCGPCRAEMPELQELADRYGGDITVVGVSIDGAGATGRIRGFLDEVGVDFVILHDPEQRVVRRFTTVGVPESFLLDAGGIVRRRWTGRFHPLDAETISLVESLLEEAG